MFPMKSSLPGSNAPLRPRRLPAGLGRAAVLVVRLCATDEPAGASPPARNPPAALNQPAPANGGTGEGNPADMNEGLFDKFDRARFNNQAASHYWLTGRPPLQHELFFFPPDPPPLGAELRWFRPPVTGTPAPLEMAAFVNEPFYPILAIRLAAEDLPKRLQLELDAYRVAKVGLQNELRSTIVRLKGADASARQRELTELARSQAPRLTTLEATAAQLRSDLQRGGLYGQFVGRGDWNECRSWRLGSRSAESARSDTLQMEFEVLRAAVCYQDGLSPAQRRLAREIAMELQAEIRQSKAGAPPVPDASMIFFLPETARIRLPADLPAELATKVTAFVTSKKELKAELRTTLYNCDAKGGDERIRVLARLAEEQAPRIAALEELAEDIRRGLAEVADMPGPPAPPVLPPELEARISTYRGHKLALLQALHALLASPDPVARRSGKPDQVREQVAAFNRENAGRFAKLKNERDALREALARHMHTLGSERDQKTIDGLLEEFESARQQQEIWEKYRDYQTAVLLPGLSPAQRRLLYDAAIEELALPLPGGEVPR